MTSHFISTYPLWLVKPSIVTNVISNSFTSLKDIPTSVSFSDNSSFITGLRQALYWRRRLSSTASSCTVIFSFLGAGGLTSPNVSEVFKALKNVPNISSPVEVYRAFSSPFIGISFSEQSSAALFRSLCLSFNDLFVIHVAPSSPDSHPFKIIGLPPLFPDHRVHHFMSKYTESHSFTREMFSPEENINIPLNSVSGSFKLKPDQHLKQLPHLIPLPAPHLGSALLIIHGRQSLCLKCGGLGHVRRFCSTPRCHTCHHFHLASSSCNSSTLHLDSSITSDWPLDISFAPITSDSSTVSPIVPESSSPKLSSSPPAILSFANIVSAGLSSIDNPSHDIIHAIPSITLHQENITMPHYLSDVTSTITKPFSSPKAVSSISTHNINLLPSSKHKEAYLAIKHVKKSSLAYKKSRRHSTSSSTSSRHLLPTGSKFAVLEDLSNSSHEDNSTKDASSPSLDSAVHNSYATQVLSDNLTSIPHSFDTHLTPASSVLTTSTHHISKKVKTASSLGFSSKIIHQPPSPSIKISDFSWGERMEKLSESTVDPESFITDQNIADPEVKNSSSELPFNPSSVMEPLPVVSSHQETDILSIPPLSSDLTPAVIESFNSDREKKLDDITIIILGFSEDTSVEVLREFAGQPSPYDILIQRNDDNIFESHLFMYHKLDDVHPILHKDGQWVGSSIISLSMQTNSSSESD